jgi:hypothetical protein
MSMLRSEGSAIPKFMVRRQTVEVKLPVAGRWPGLWWIVGAMVVALTLLDGALTHWSAVMVTLSAIVIPIYLGVPPMIVAMKDLSARRPDASGTNSKPHQPFKIVIANDGHFVGGDIVAIDLVTAMLEIPAADREVQVDAEPLHDAKYKYNNPGDYIDLRKSIRLYSNALNIFLQGGIHYCWKWHAQDLADAILELRRLALPAGRVGERWFTWPATGSDPEVDVWVSEAEVKRIQSGYYRDNELPGGFESIQGMPSDEPIWLQDLFPRVVWTCVAPAVTLCAAQGRSESGSIISLDDWVISNRRPTELIRRTPSEKPGGLQPEPWSW